MELSRPPHSPPSTPRRKHLSRDQCLQIMALYEGGKNQSQIAAQLGISRGQVYYLLRRGSVIPKKRKGRLPKLSTEVVNGIEKFINESYENRSMSYMELALRPFSHLDVSECVIKSELRKRRYRRHPAHNKPSVSELTRRRRREWASAHID
ncbi:hypothetical protein K3495_g8057 [Podosphaera aphanis]|nr:hypothetical protein K3495_g8057 [Podosphaera aphanis]